MANEKESLKNYESVLWLWDASDIDRINFLASLTTKQRTYFCYILQDILNNPHKEKRSVIKMTGLNSLLGQRQSQIKKHIQFSGDRTPSFNEEQIFRLLHDYVILHRKTPATDIGKNNLEQLLEEVNTQFNIYYTREKTHPQLMWDGFQNDTQFPSEGMEKSPADMDPDSFEDLKAKISNYYFPVGGRPKPTPPPETSEYEHEEYENENNSDEQFVPVETLKSLSLRYFPVIFSYILFAMAVAYTAMESAESIILLLITLFAAVKWYNIFKRYDRVWASLLQGFWVINHTILIACQISSVKAFACALIWMLFAFWALVKKSHTPSALRTKFATAWLLILSILGALAIIPFATRQHEQYQREQRKIRMQEELRIQQQAAIYERELEKKRAEAERKAAQERVAQERQESQERTAQAHIQKIRSQVGGIRWNSLIDSDLKFLTPTEINTLRLQLVSAMRNTCGNIDVLCFENLEPSTRYGYLKANIILNEPIYVITSDRSGITKQLNIGNVYSIDFDTPANQPFSCAIRVNGNNWDIVKNTKYNNALGLKLLFGNTQLEKTLKQRNRAYVQIDSYAERDLKTLANITNQLKNQIRSDELIAQADSEAKDRLTINKQKLQYLQTLVKKIYTSDTIIMELPSDLKQVANGDWSKMPIIKKR